MGGRGRAARCTQLLTVDVGNVKNPQRRILGARIAYGQSAWAAAAADDATPSHYTLSARVTFLHVADGATVEVRILRCRSWPARQQGGEAAWRRGSIPTHSEFARGGAAGATAAVGVTMG